MTDPPAFNQPVIYDKSARGGHKLIDLFIGANIHVGGSGITAAT